MNKHVILSALESQLATKKAELADFESEVSNPSKIVLTQEVLDILRSEVSPLIPNITLSSDRLEFTKAESVNKKYNGWTGLTVYIETPWIRNGEEVVKFAKMNWYGTSATLKDENTLIDVQVFGAVASKLAWIEYEMINNWGPKYLAIETKPNQMLNEIYQIERSIRDTQTEIRNEGIQKYKVAGFYCAIDPMLSIEMDWEQETRPYILKQSTPNIKLSIGRSKWDYVHPKAFKVIKSNKYKTTLEVTQTQSDTVREYTVTANSYDSFINEVYEWQNGRSKQHNESTTSKFNERYATK